MADIYSSIYPDPTQKPRRLVDSTYTRGRIRTQFAKVDAVADLGVGDKAFVCKIPSHAHLLPDTQIHFEQIAGATSVHFGSSEDPDALVAAQDMATAAGNVAATDAVPTANLSMRLWQMVGYTEDPRIDIPLFLTFNTDVTGAGAIQVDLRYVVD